MFVCICTFDRLIIIVGLLVVGFGLMMVVWLWYVVYFSCICLLLGLFIGVVIFAACLFCCFNMCWWVGVCCFGLIFVFGVLFVDSLFVAVMLCLFWFVIVLFVFVRVYVIRVYLLFI